MYITASDTPTSWTGVDLRLLKTTTWFGSTCVMTTWKQLRSRFPTNDYSHNLNHGFRHFVQMIFFGAYEHASKRSRTLLAVARVAHPFHNRWKWSIDCNSPSGLFQAACVRHVANRFPGKPRHLFVRTQIQCLPSRMEPLPADVRRWSPARGWRGKSLSPANSHSPLLDTGRRCAVQSWDKHYPAGQHLTELLVVAQCLHVDRLCAVCECVRRTLGPQFTTGFARDNVQP